MGSAMWANRGRSVFPEGDAIRAHFVLAGEVQLTLENGDVARLPSGTIALLPFGAAHRLGGARGSRAMTTDELGVDERSGFYRLRIGGDGAAARIVCCTLHFDNPVASALLLGLPELITIAAGEAEDAILRQLFAMMDSETRLGRIGAATVVTRLVDIAVIRVLRSWLEVAEPPETGLKTAIRDPRIGAALAAIHRAPDRPLSIERLAQIAGLSRTVFTERFKRALGTSPGRYVSDWRITVARSLLQSSSLSIKAIAEWLGYKSESSFSRAFKKSAGIPPSRMRRGPGDAEAP